MGGRGKEGRGLPGAERAAVERELEPPPSVPRLPGECESPAGLGAAGSRVGIAVERWWAGGARPSLRIPGAPRERRQRSRGPRAECGRAALPGRG